MNKIGKSTDSLMRHIRNEHNINIHGSKQKIALINMGYFHSYKAYRFNKNPKQLLPIRDFSEIQTVHTLDSNLKELFYPELMKIETALKNRVINFVSSNCEASIYSIIDNKLTYAKDIKDELKEARKELEDLRKRNAPNPDISKARKKVDITLKRYHKQNSSLLKLKSSVDNLISEDYRKKGITQHYLHSNQPIPIWACFELFSLGNLAYFIMNLNVETKKELCRKLGFQLRTYDPKILTDSIFLLKDLRNAVAHNKIIFDCRFQNNISKTVKHYYRDSINNLDFSFKSITDYVIVVYYFLTILKFSKTECTRFIKKYKSIISKLKQDSSFQDVFNSIFCYDDFNKLDTIIS